MQVQGHREVAPSGASGVAESAVEPDPTPVAVWSGGRVAVVSGELPKHTTSGACTCEACHVAAQEDWARRFF
jgi:hypothetical protein